MSSKKKNISRKTSSGKHNSKNKKSTPDFSIRSEILLLIVLAIAVVLGNAFNKIDSLFPS